jgi:hypothetical protein
MDNRIYQYVGALTIRKSHVLQGDTLPKDDILPWLFLAIDKKGERRFTFFYKIEQPEVAFYEKPFNIQMSFIMDNMERVIELNHTYDVWRGEDSIGKVKIVEILKSQ